MNNFKKVVDVLLVSISNSQIQHIIRKKFLYTLKYFEKNGSVKKLEKIHCRKL